MKRNRIVINLEDKPRRSARSGRGLGKPLLISGIVLLLVVGGLAAGGYFWWRHYQNGPSYTLALLVDAVQHNDSATVDKILDADKISDDFVTQVRQKLPNAPDSLLQSQTDSIKSSISARLKETLREQLMKELQQLTDVAANKPFFLIALAVPRFVDLKEENNVAKGTANIKDQQIQLTMQSDGKSWRIVAVKDDKLAKMVADSMVNSVPTNGSQLQDAIKKQLEKMNK